MALTHITCVCFASMWSPGMEVCSVKCTALGPFLLISAPLRAVLRAEVCSSKPGNMCGLAHHMSLQMFHHRKLLSILKQLFLSALI